jgi:hypothetical protein
MERAVTSGMLAANVLLEPVRRARPEPLRSIPSARPAHPTPHGPRTGVQS